MTKPQNHTYETLEMKIHAIEKTATSFSFLSTPMASLSSLFLSQPRSLRPNSTTHYSDCTLHLPTRSASFYTRASSQSPNKLTTEPPAAVEKKSLAVATGELFLGIASRILKRRADVGGEEGAKFVPMKEESERESTSTSSSPSSSWFWSWRKEGIASVLEDPVQPEVVWKQRLKDVEAERGRKAVSSPGFSFSAAGLLFPYHLGVAQFLIEKGYIKETTPLAGSSAGAIVCAVIASGAQMQEALNATKILAEDCRRKGTAFRLGVVLRDVLDKFLPDDVHLRSNGRVRVAVTQILWRPRGLLIDQFDSKEDLINAVFTSSFIPGFLAPRPATMFRDRLCIDGGLTLFMPPTSASQTVRVCAFPASRLGMQGIGISPDCNPENRATPRQLFNWALEPPEDYVLDKLFELGYLDAAVWGQQNPIEKLVREDSRHVENGVAQ